MMKKYFFVFKSWKDTLSIYDVRIPGLRGDATPLSKIEFEKLFLKLFVGKNKRFE